MMAAAAQFGRTGLRPPQTLRAKGKGQWARGARVTRLGRRRDRRQRTEDCSPWIAGSGRAGGEGRRGRLSVPEGRIGRYGSSGDCVRAAVRDKRRRSSRRGGTAAAGAAVGRSGRQWRESWRLSWCLPGGGVRFVLAEEVESLWAGVWCWRELPRDGGVVGDFVAREGRN